MVACYRLMLLGALGSCLFNNMSFLSIFLTLTPSVNGFAELPATLVSKLGCYVDIHVVNNQVGFEFSTRPM